MISFKVMFFLFIIIQSCHHRQSKFNIKEKKLSSKKSLTNNVQIIDRKVMKENLSKMVQQKKDQAVYQFSNGRGDGMRIMLLASGDLWAGAEVMVCQLACGLKKLDDIMLLAVVLNGGRLAEELREQGISTMVLEEKEQSIPGLTKQIYKIVKSFSPHIIHSHRYKENLLAWLVTRAIGKIKLVATQHGMPEMIFEKQMVKQKLKAGFYLYFLSMGFKKTVTVSQEMKNLLSKHYCFPEKKIEVIHNGILLPRAAKKNPSNVLTVGSAGRLFPVKGYDFFIKVAAKITKISDRFKFVIAGDGPERKRLERVIAKMGLKDKFALLGNVDDMSRFYKKLDVYVNTSVHEGIPMSVLEAMGHGLPVVVPHVGGFPEIVVDGECGYLIAERDVNLFAQKILGLVDLDQRKKMEKSARKRVDQLFSRKIMTEKYHNLYNNILSKEK